MDFDDYYQLGHVLKRHGLIGEIVVDLDVSDPQHYRKLDVVFIREGSQLVPHFVTHIQISSNKARLRLEDVDTPEGADGLVGKDVYLPTKYLPKLQKGEYYYHDLIGFEVISHQKPLGDVLKIYDLGSQHLFSIEVEGKEVMIPLNSEILSKVDLENRKVFVDLPDGLLEVYTKS